jgi:putative kinase
MSDPPALEATNPSLEPQGYPQAWKPLESLAGPARLNVAGYAVTIEISPEQLDRVYLPLLALLDRLASDLHNERLLVGLVGIPGSGKSTFAAALEYLGKKVLGPQKLIVVGMDGWHWPNHILDQRTTVDQTGRTLPLRQRKGGPESFDVDNLASALTCLRDSKSNVSLPVYNRQHHEPEPDTLLIPPHTPIILMEGNYLLHNQPPWYQISDKLFPKLFLECDPKTARQRILERHIRGGATSQQAKQKYQNNDQLNTEVVLKSASNHDLRITL